jgi:hypothetical protein
MRRRAWSGITLMSFILSVLVGGVWLRSYIQLDLITRRVKDELHYKEHMLAWSRGRVTLSYIHRLSDPQDVPKAISPEAMQWAWDVEDPIIIRSGRSAANGYGFTALAGTTYQPPSVESRGATWTKYGLVLPCWFLFTLSLILPSVAWHRGRPRVTKPASFPIDPPAPPA